MGPDKERPQQKIDCMVLVLGLGGLWGFCHCDPSSYQLLLLLLLFFSAFFLLSLTVLTVLAGHSTPVFWIEPADSLKPHMYLSTPMYSFH
jgi:hypothetical protein